MENEKRLIDANALMKRFYNYYDCVNEFTSKNGYRGDTLMDYEVADMIYNCIDNSPTVDAVSVKDLERILSTTPGLGLWDYQKRGIMSAVYRLCGKEKNDE